MVTTYISPKWLTFFLLSAVSVMTKDRNNWKSYGNKTEKYIKTLNHITQQL